MNIKQFELGKYYRHTDGSKIYIAGVADTKYHGVCFVGENPLGEIFPIGIGKGGYSQNYTEITEEEFLGKEDNNSVDASYIDTLGLRTLIVETQGGRPLKILATTRGQAINKAFALFNLGKCAFPLYVCEEVQEEEEKASHHIIYFIDNSTVSKAIVKADSVSWAIAKFCNTYNIQVSYAINDIIINVVPSEI